MITNSPTLPHKALGIRSEDKYIPRLSNFRSPNPLPEMPRRSTRLSSKIPANSAFEKLPDELLLEIATYLSPRTMACLSQTSKYLNDFTTAILYEDIAISPFNPWSWRSLLLTLVEKPDHADHVQSIRIERRPEEANEGTPAIAQQSEQSRKALNKSFKRCLPGIKDMMRNEVPDLYGLRKQDWMRVLSSTHPTCSDAYVALILVLCTKLERFSSNVENLMTSYAKWRWTMSVILSPQISFTPKLKSLQLHALLQPYLAFERRRGSISVGPLMEAVSIRLPTRLPYPLTWTDQSTADHKPVLERLCVVSNHVDVASLGDFLRHPSSSSIETLVITGVEQPFANGAENNPGRWLQLITTITRDLPQLSDLALRYQYQGLPEDEWRNCLKLIAAAEKLQHLGMYTCHDFKSSFMTNIMSRLPKNLLSLTFHDWDSRHLEHLSSAAFLHDIRTYSPPSLASICTNAYATIRYSITPEDWWPALQTSLAKASSELYPSLGLSLEVAVDLETRDETREYYSSEHRYHSLDCGTWTQLSKREYETLPMCEHITPRKLDNFDWM